MESEDKTELLVCVGTFDHAGIPITVTKHLSDRATVAFQTISLNMLVANLLDIAPAEVAYVHSKDGTSIKIERNFKGFIGYLQASNQSEP
ncbi:hypothetical protein ACKFKG_02360 [Phormidesmis sp. 146-35]